MVIAQKCLLSVRSGSFRVGENQKAICSISLVNKERSPYVQYQLPLRGADRQPTTAG